MEVTPDRPSDLVEELKKWSTKRLASRKEMESLVGKLRYICNVVHAGRFFLARIFNWLRQMDRGKRYPVDPVATKDILVDKFLTNI